jgi:hypothetical protein
MKYSPLSEALGGAGVLAAGVRATGDASRPDAVGAMAGDGARVEAVGEAAGDGARVEAVGEAAGDGARVEAVGEAAGDGARVEAVGAVTADGEGLADDCDWEELLQPDSNTAAATQTQRLFMAPRRTCRA